MTTAGVGAAFYFCRTLSSVHIYSLCFKSEFRAFKLPSTNVHTVQHRESLIMQCKSADTIVLMNFYRKKLWHMCRLNFSTWNNPRLFNSFCQITTAQSGLKISKISFVVWNNTRDEIFKIFVEELLVCISITLSALCNGISDSPFQWQSSSWASTAAEQTRSTKEKWYIMEYTSLFRLSTVLPHLKQSVMKNNKALLN